MQKQSQFTATGASAVVELGFVPDRLIIKNRTSLAEIEWNANLDAGYYYKRVAAGTLTLETSGGPTLIDGSDKTNNLDKSFGVVLPAIVDINDTASEILDITAIKDDDV